MTVALGSSGRARKSRLVNLTVPVFVCYNGDSKIKNKVKNDPMY